MSAMFTENFFGKLLIAVFFLFAVYSNLRLVIRNHQLNQRVEEVRQDVKEAEARNEKLKLLLAYYQTPEYQEIEARRRLGLKKPEETALVVKGAQVPQESLDQFEDVLYQDLQAPAPEPQSNFSQWLEYFSGKK
jgi:cell division protein FtsB